MLDDRKFYNNINSALSPPSPEGRAGGRGGRVAAQWRPIGPDEAVVMDRKKPYVGVHTPLIQLAGDSPRGSQQAGLALRKGKAYTARVVLAGPPRVQSTARSGW